MISIIIPCVSLKKGIQSAKNVSSNILNNFEIIIVNDGQLKNKSYKKGLFIIYELKGINGSYFCRNFGASKSKGKWLYFLDSNINYTNKFKIDLNEDEIGFFDITFNRKPKNNFEKWYYNNAFKIKFFIKMYNFVPTISLIVSKANFNKINGFNSKLYSSGDVDFCNRLNLKYNKIKNSSLIIDLRNKEEIFLKLERQILGHCINKINNSSRLNYYIYVSIKLLKNLFSSLIFSLHNKEYSKIYLFKSKISFNCLLNSKFLKNKIIKTNSLEVRLDQKN